MPRETSATPAIWRGLLLRHVFSPSPLIKDAGSSGCPQDVTERLTAAPAQAGPAAAAREGSNELQVPSGLAQLCLHCQHLPFGGNNSTRSCRKAREGGAAGGRGQRGPCSQISPWLYPCYMRCPGTGPGAPRARAASLEKVFLSLGVWQTGGCNGLPRTPPS